MHLPWPIRLAARALAGRACGSARWKVTVFSNLCMDIAPLCRAALAGAANGRGLRLCRRMPRGSAPQGAAKQMQCAGTSGARGRFSADANSPCPWASRSYALSGLVRHRRAACRAAPKPKLRWPARHRHRGLRQSRQNAWPGGAWDECFTNHEAAVICGTPSAVAVGRS